jgi:uncharacterized phage-associated protein
MESELYGASLAMDVIPMSFRFSLPKATEVACALLARAGGQINVMKLVKLMYLLDRLSIDRRGIPVVGGQYLSMRNGPVTSELLDLVNAGRLDGEPDTRWEQSISDRVNHEVRLEAIPAREYLSEADMELLDLIWNEHGHRDQWQLVDWCHTYCVEWTPLDRGSAPIAVELIAQALGKTQEAISRISREERELNQLDDIFATA